MEIDFIDETEKVSNEHMELIEDLLVYAAKEESVSPLAELSVTFVNNEEIQQLNKQYRDLDKPTDVLSFALEEETDGEITIHAEDLPVVLGDIVISIDKAEEQAKDYNHSVSREFGFLALHGFLHLLGYDHMEEAEEKKMFARQEEILNGFGLSR
ncbi:rRNA maturation RNase YbeY [Gracilibacillus oryzae]|uniref:Endoribonuclease YbeY n=1 Tax=Gracilibacillus oryzae TaxID=1672701 RepID=A0A7C8KX16_9BACI|nr:rRNA maturation RNase YbeY [Gracilibacillus oryzae]KAB8128732.1 rRNA maturation RNase YbeY [Gracilibacillus oryzae]